MTWGPPSEVTPSYFVFSLRLVFSSAFRSFSRHLVCASKKSAKQYQNQLKIWIQKVQTLLNVYKLVHISANVKCGMVQPFANLVDFEKCCKMSIYAIDLQNIGFDTAEHEPRQVCCAIMVLEL